MLTHTFNNSSTLSIVDYRQETKVMTITFKSGGIYEFYEVPLELVENFLKTEALGVSSGKFFHKEIKGKYLSQRRDANWLVEEGSMLYGWLPVKLFPIKALAIAYTDEQKAMGNQVNFRIREQKIIK